jgi:hypothetical protein
MVILKKEVMAMEIDLGTFLVIVYSIVDDLYRARYAPLKPRRRGHKPELSDSEVLTLAMLAQWQQNRSESGFVKFVQEHWQQYFPRMLSQSAFNRRVRDLAGVLCRLGPDVARLARQYLASPLAYEVLDGVPVPLMRRCRGNRHRLFANEAAMGRGGSDHDWYYGVKLLLAVSPDGPVTGFVFGPANTEERWLAEALLRWRLDPSLPAPTVEQLVGVLGFKRLNGEPWVGPTGPILAVGVGQVDSGLYIGDLGFAGRVWDHHWLEDYAALVMTKKDYDHLAYAMPSPEATGRERRQGHRQLASPRQVIETVNNCLDSVLGLKYPRARSFWGLLARIGAKIAAYNIAIHINLMTHRKTFSLFNPLPQCA